MDKNTNQCSATPHELLIESLLDPRIPKTEREHAAAREIEKLRAEIMSTGTDLARLREAVGEHCRTCTGTNEYGCDGCHLKPWRPKEGE